MSERTFKDLTIWERSNGLSYLHKRTIHTGAFIYVYEGDTLTSEEEILDYKEDYGGISYEDMHNYTFEENAPFDRYWSEEEKQFFKKEYDRIKWRKTK